ncbi:hypothetical protein Golax_001056 [Gossypium laxum]|uniref:Uncharacterized protein n=1 Tax=Gossypium laxum TaxID=34288 RepID=A0A7J9AVM2_9ROSI|nr:hypothetical protein [Gossypium laxum]
MPLYILVISIEMLIFMLCFINSCKVKVYTHEIYRCFEKKFLDGVPLIWREVAQNGTSYTFEVMMDENSSRV